MTGGPDGARPAVPPAAAPPDHRPEPPAPPAAEQWPELSQHIPGDVVDEGVLLTSTLLRLSRLADEQAAR
jgi:hypothetical protein